MNRALLPLLLIASLACAQEQEPPESSPEIQQEPETQQATLQEQLADESIPIASRTWTLALHATCLYAAGDSATAAKLLDDWSKAHAGQPLPVAFYSTRFFVAWLGQSDAETARRQIKQMDALVSKGAIPADDPHYTLMTQSYYNHLQASKIERASQYARRVGR